MKFYSFLILVVIGSTLGCEDGWKPYGTKCYFFSTTVVEFKGAKSACAGKTATLAIVKSSGLNNFLKAEIGSNFWVGLTCPSGCGVELKVATRRRLFRWVDGSGVNVLEFGSLEPARQENCGALNPNGKYYGFGCNWKLKYICVKDPPVPEPTTAGPTTTAETTIETIVTTEASTATTVTSKTTEASTAQSSTTEATTQSSTIMSTTIATTAEALETTTQSLTTMSTTKETTTEASTTETQPSIAATSTSATQASTGAENETITTITPETTTTRKSSITEAAPIEAKEPSLLVIILGGAVGGAFFLIVIFLLIWLVKSRNKKKSIPEDEPDEKYRKRHPLLGPVIPIESIVPNPFPVPELIDVIRAELDKGSDGFSAYTKFAKKSSATTSVGNNNKFNRYRDILPYNFNRVELQTHLGSKKMKNAPSEGYINASYVSNENEVKYIASQGPTPQTLAHFWQMIDEADVNVIVMLTQIVESAKRKCEPYWPESVGKFEKFGDYNISLENESIEYGYVKRTLKVSRDAIEDESGGYQSIQDHIRTVTQFFCLEWPDMYVPKDSGPILHMMEQIDQLKADKHYTGPTLVHCSAGVGRTGTFIGIDFQLQKARRENMLDIHTCIRELREYRMSMIQKQTQWTFIFSTLLEALTVWNSSIKVHDLKNTIEERKRKDEDGQIAFDKEYEVLEVIARIIAPSEPYNYLHLKSFMQGRERQVDGMEIRGYAQPELFYISLPTKPENRVDLLRLIYDHKIKAVINIVKEDEDGDNMFGEEETFENYTTTEYNRTNGGISYLITRKEGESGEEMPETDFTIYTFTKSNHLDILDEKAFVDFYQKARADLSGDNQQPVLVTSTEGYSIAALFCQATAMCDMISVTNEVDVYKTVKKTCASSLECMPSKAQYLFLYKLAHLFVTRGSSRAIPRDRHIVRIDI